MKMKREDIIRGLASFTNHHKSIPSSSTTTTTQSPAVVDSQGAATAASGNKVLPISENTANSVTLAIESKDGIQSSSNKEKNKENSMEDRKAKAISRMKELVRWAAPAKSDKGSKYYLSKKVLQLRNKGKLKALGKNNSIDDQHSMESPKISFRWDVESCSTTSTPISTVSMPCSLTNNSTRSDQYCTGRKGNWITTDSEFVVLEL